MSFEGNVASLDFPDPDADFPDLAGNSENKEDDPTSFVKPGKGKHDFESAGGGVDPPYILGTLIVRVVAARDLEPVQKGGGFGNLLMNSARRSTNPYASVKFANTTQRTSEVFDSLDPIWPRQETIFMDVALPGSKLTHPETVTTTGQALTSASMPGEIAAASAKEDIDYEKPNSLLTIALFHNPDFGDRGSNKYPNKGGNMSGDSDDMFLGMASADLTRLLTGTDGIFDKWLTLTGTETSRGSVRIVCEYEPSDPPPRPNDFCRFTRYCHPKDLYPLVPGRQYRVAEVDGDIILITYTSQEGWVCSFEAHRYMLFFQQHASPVESAQDELVLMAERLSYSPLVTQVAETVERVAVDGLLGVSSDLVHSGWGLMNRWLEGGVDTAISDVTNVTNWDGRYNPDNAERLDLPEATSSDSFSTNADLNRTLEPNDAQDKGHGDTDVAKALQGMPSCPITGEPMVDPVVAADGKPDLGVAKSAKSNSCLCTNCFQTSSAYRSYL